MLCSLRSNGWAGVSPVLSSPFNFMEFMVYVCGPELCRSVIRPCDLYSSSEPIRKNDITTTDDRWGKYIVRNT